LAKISNYSEGINSIFAIPGHTSLSWESRQTKFPKKKKTTTNPL